MQAFKMLEEIVKKGWKPNVYTHTSLIDRLCKKGWTEKAFRLFLVVFGEGFVQDCVLVVFGFGAMFSMTFNLGNSSTLYLFSLIFFLRLPLVFGINKSYFGVTELPFLNPGTKTLLVLSSR